MKVLFSSARPHLSILPILCFIAGIATVSPTSFPLLTILFGSIAFLFVYSGGCILDDIYDLDIDQLLHPKRPLPSGELSKRRAWYYFVLFCLVSLPIAYVVDWRLLLVMLLYILLAFAFSHPSSRYSIARHVMYAFYTFSLPYLSGNLVIVGLNLSSKILVFSGMLLIWGIAIRFAKDFVDMEEDRRRNRMSLPLRVGKERAAKLVSLLLFAPYVLGPIPYVLLDLSILYLIAMISIGLLFGAVSILVIRNPSSQRTPIVAYSLAHIIPIAIIIGVL